MFYGFNIELNDKNFEDLKKDLTTNKAYYEDICDYSNHRGIKKFIEIGNNTLDKNKELIEKDLEKYINVDGTIDASTLENDWFPSVKIDVFLSHSHMDRDNAIILAGILKEKFDLNVFIDSCFWGYAEYSANRRPLVTVEKSTKYAEQVHFIKILNTLRSPL